MIENLSDLFLAGTTEHPRPDLLRQRTEHGWSSFSSERVRELVERTYAGLAARGIRKGDRVAILSENRPEWAVADFAALRLGAVVVPVYATMSIPEVVLVLRRSGAALAFGSSAEQLEKLLAARRSLPSLRAIVGFDDPGFVGVIDFSSLLEEGEDRAPPRVHGADLASIIFTSGTEGEPKGVMLTHENLVENVLSVTRLIDVGEDDSYLSFLPLAHVFERTAGHFANVFRGVSISYARSSSTLRRDFLEVKPTLLFGVPRFFEKVRNAARSRAAKMGEKEAAAFGWAERVAMKWAARRVGGHSIGGTLGLARRVADRLVFAKIREAVGGRVRLAVSGGAPLDPDLAAFLYGAGLPVLEGYGLTETAPVIAVNTPEDLRFGTVGRPLPGVEVKISPEGEVLTRSRSVMRGYYHSPDETRRAFTHDGWFRTGDLGRLDEGGFLTVTGRLKEMLVTSTGENVAPGMIERRLERSPLVARAVVLGDHRRYVTALIVPEFTEIERRAREEGVDPVERRRSGVDGARGLLESVVSDVNRELGRPEQIKRFAVLSRDLREDRGEITPTQKVRRKVVLASFSEEIEQLYRSSPASAALPQKST